MSGNERKRQKREDQETARRISGDASDNVAKSENTPTAKSHPLPKLPADVWGKHIAPFLHRKELNNLLAQGGKEIYEACQNLKFPWPTVELRLPELHLPVYNVDRYDTDPASRMLRAISPDSKWIIIAPVIGFFRHPRGQEAGVYHAFNGVNFFHSRYGRAKGVVPLPGRSSSSPRDFQKSSDRYYPQQISISKDGRYLAVSYLQKIEVDAFRITFHEESESPSVSLELHRTFELDTTTATSPFQPITHSCQFVLSTNSKWLISFYKGDYVGPDLCSCAVVAWDIETGAIVKSEVGTELLDPIYNRILATDSMIVWRCHSTFRLFAMRAWLIENERFSNVESIEIFHPDSDLSRDNSIYFSELVPSPVDPSTFIVVAEETQETKETQVMTIDMLKWIASTEHGVSTTVQKLRRFRLSQDTSQEGYAGMSFGWYPDGQYLILYDHVDRRFRWKTIDEENADRATPCIGREELVDKASVISQWDDQEEFYVDGFELSPDGKFLTMELKGYYDRPGRGFFVVSGYCGSTLEDIKRRSRWSFEERRRIDQFSPYVW